jgi:hypothetical protein
MSTVVETLGKYEVFLKKDRENKPATLRKVRLSLSYFAELFGEIETKDLVATDMHTFYHWLKKKKSKKSKKGTEKPF